MIAEGDLVRERYLVESRIGAGAMGVVWRARDQRLERAVAIKQLYLRPGLEPTEVERLKRRAVREGRITARLAHPHAIAMYDAVEHESEVCLVMEYLPSASLSAVLAERGALPPEQVAEIGRQVASALQLAHQLDVLHRDVKPGNILVADNGTAKVTDFGISQGLDGGSTTTTGLFAGTLAYLAPEVARGGTAGFPSDVFSLGATLYSAVEGGPPFGVDENALALLHRVAFDEIIPPACPDPLRSVLLRMLDRDPDARPTMAEAHAELAAAAGAANVVGLAGPALTRATSAAAPTASDTPAAEPEPKRQDTLRAAPVAPETAPEPAAAPVAAAAPAAPSTGGETRSRTGKRRLAAVLVGTGLGLVAALVIILSNRSGTPAAAPTTPPATPPTTTTTAPPAVSSTQPTPTTTTQAAESPQQAINDYYALMPGDLEAGWTRMTDRYRSAHTASFADYQGFWSAIARVDVVRSTANGDQVSATIRYVYKTGRVVQDTTTFGLVPDNGQWKIDSMSVTSSQAVG